MQRNTCCSLWHGRALNLITQNEVGKELERIWRRFRLGSHWSPVRHRSPFQVQFQPEFRDFCLDFLFKCATILLILKCSSVASRACTRFSGCILDAEHLTGAVYLYTGLHLEKRSGFMTLVIHKGTRGRKPVRTKNKVSNYMPPRLK